MALPDKENLSFTCAGDTVQSQRSCKVLAFSERQGEGNQESSMLERSEEQIVKEYSANPFFRKQLHYLIKTSLRYNPKMEVEDYDCSQDFQKTDSHYQQEGHYLRNDIYKLRRVMAALGIDQNHPALK